MIRQLHRSDNGRYIRRACLLTLLLAGGVNGAMDPADKKNRHVNAARRLIPLEEQAKSEQGLQPGDDVVTPFNLSGESFRKDLQRGKVLGLVGENKVRVQ